MPWSRPVPLIGDATSAADRSGDPRAWAFADDQRDALLAVIGARRDVRRFRPEPVPEPTLRRVLAAAHAAPSVGHSQPWRFVLVTDAATRERAALIADRERLAQAAQLAQESARRPCWTLTRATRSGSAPAPTARCSPARPRSSPPPCAASATGTDAGSPTR